METIGNICTERFNDICGDVTKSGFKQSCLSNKRQK